ncbi:MAG: arsenate reductase ArsC, partial [Candidatus Neomarinimicrobiota bacterium]
MVSKQKVLFVCTGNSCRSQIAEGLLNKMAAKYFEVYSAGSHPSRVHPNAISVMREINIDISNHTSNSVVEYLNTGIDIVITVCDNAKLACPIFPKKTMEIHWSIDDP